ncbi:hypothetical protein [uncultured Maricaulis sp.]|uniref:hypothetical protein n=1 Tax=uncultured Maricaulis sp. TaxID=174710 RepID=UPI0030DC5FCC
MKRSVSIFLMIVVMLGLGGFDTARADDLVRIELRFPDTLAGGAPAEFQVRITVPGDRLAALELRDMSRRTPDCPGVDYDVLSVVNADITAHDLRRDGRVDLVPRGPGPVEITYRVSAVLRADDVSINNVLACSVVIVGADNIFIDRRAMFPALRPVDETGEPFRFGEAEVRLIGWAGTGPVVFPSAEQVAPSIWHLDHLDDLRFSYLAAGRWTASPHRSRGNSVAVYGWPLDGDHAAAAAALGDVSDMAGRVLDYLETAWGGEGIGGYSALLLQTGGRHGEFAAFTATAQGNAQAMFYGPGVAPAALRIGVAHEIAHIWAPGRLGSPNPDATSHWIGEGLADFASYRVLIELGALEPSALLDRANVALQNRQIAHTPELADYDYGFLAWLRLDTGADGALLSPGLDAFVRALIDGHDAPITAERFWSTAMRLGLWRGETDKAQLEQTMPCQLRTGGEDYNLVEGRWPRYALGWELSDEQPGMIARIVEDGPAARAGLQASDRILRLKSGGFGNIHRPVTAEFISGDERRSASFLPRGEMGPQVYLQYVEDVEVTRLWADIAPPARCRPPANQAVR